MLIAARFDPVHDDWSGESIGHWYYYPGMACWDATSTSVNSTDLLVDVAPAPQFVRLEAAHDGVRGLAEVAICVAASRRVATSDVSAAEAQAQVHPLRAIA